MTDKRPSGDSGVLKALIIGLGALAVIGATLWFAFGGGGSDARMTPEAARADLSEKVADIPWRRIQPARVPVEQRLTDIADTLPEIGQFPLVVAPPPGPGVAEIFVSTEKSGEAEDGWMREAAAAFNASGARTASGAPARIAIRKIASGTGYLGIASGKYAPDAFSPSNALWIDMARARGAQMEEISPRTVGNIAGVVMKTAVADRLRAEDALNLSGIVDSVVQGRLVLGYANPQASSTGMNFLVSLLMAFSDGDAGAILTPEAVSAFEAFQATVPFVASTTLQLRESVRRDGSFDAFVMEWQTFANTEELSSGYEFIPFGWPHDNPLYAVGELSDPKREALALFAEFIDSTEQQRRASAMGFNPEEIEHTGPGAKPDGARLVRAQKVWKERRNAGRPAAAVFIADVSGSMAGRRIAMLKRSLLDGSSFILPETAIGLIEFSSHVRVALPIKPFGELHRAAFHGAVARMQPGGGTAMYDAIAVGLDRLMKHRDANPDIRPLLIVLTDGETNEGLKYGEMNAMIAGLGVPIYTIGFEADVAELERLSQTVEAASFQATVDNLRHLISGSIINPQL